VSGTWLVVAVYENEAAPKHDKTLRHGSLNVCLHTEVGVDVDTKAAYRRHRVDHDTVDRQGR